MPSHLDRLRFDASFDSVEAIAQRYGITAEEATELLALAHEQEDTSADVMDVVASLVHARTRNRRRPGAPGSTSIRSAYGIRVFDSDVGRASETLRLATSLSSALELTSNLDIHVDGLAECRTNREGTTGLFDNGIVYLNPSTFQPSTPSGRRLIAHELTHAAQHRVGLGIVIPGAAEAEADYMGSLFARGSRVHAPTQRLATGFARDEGRTAASQEATFLKRPPPLPMVVNYDGLVFRPPDEMRWAAGMSKSLQLLAITLKRLVGSSYTPALARAAQTYMAGRMRAIGSVRGNAVDDEKMPRVLRVQPGTATALIHWLRGEPNKLKVRLKPKELQLLFALTDSRQIWRHRHLSKHRLPLWYSPVLFRTQTVNLQVEPLLMVFRAKMAEFEANKNETTKTAAIAAIDAVIEKLLPDATLLEGIRADASITDHGVYRGMWHLPAATKGEKIAPIGAQSQIDIRAALAVLQQARTNAAAGATARAGGGGASAARRTLLDGAAHILRKHNFDESATGSAQLRDNESRANTPPIPSTLRAYPALQPPFFDKAAGASHKFMMSLHYQDVFDALAGKYDNHYKWEVIRIPEDKWENLTKTAEDQKVKGYRPKWGDVIGQRVSRQGRYFAADAKRVIGAVEGIEAVLGGYGAGGLTLAAAARGLAVIGEVISTFIAMITEPSNERTIPLKGSGLFVVRCTATRMTHAKDAQVIRASSVAWLPVWVRAPANMSAQRLEFQLRGRSASENRLREIAEELKNPTLSANDRAGLIDERKRIQKTLTGSLGDQLQQERDALLSRKAELERGTGDDAAPLQLRQINKRLDELKEILKLRAERHAKYQVAGLESPLRLLAVFAGDKGKTIHLGLEVIQRPAPAERFRYRAIDATTKKGSEADGKTEKTRADAIASAVQLLLEKRTGYGRGYVTIHIPPRGGRILSVAADADASKLMRTIRIEATGAAIAMEGIESLATIVSVAAIAAVPLTGGASLAILLPVGAIGAIPSAYRLADRASTGTLSMDMATAMDIVNIVGGVAGLGQASGLRVINLRGAMMIVGLGSDGMGVALAGAQFLDAIEQIDPKAPRGLRRAMLMELIGQQLVSLGMHVGASLARRGAHLKAQATGAGAAHDALPRAAAALHSQFEAKAGRKTPLLEDPALKGNTVEVRYDIDGYGLVTNVRVAFAKGVNFDLVMSKAPTVATLRKFSGVSALVRNLMDRIAVMVTGKKPPKPGTRAWDAKRAIEQIPADIATYQKRVLDGKLSAADADVKIADLQAQLKRHERDLNDLSASDRKITSRDTTATAVGKNYPKPPKGHYYLRDGSGYRLVRTPTSDEVPKRLKKTPSGWTFEEVPLAARKPKPNSETVEPIRKQLAEIHPEHTFELAKEGGDLIRIDDQLNMHPDLIGELGGKRRWKDMLSAIAELKANGGDISKLSKDAQALIKRYRLADSTAGARKTQRAFADEILKELGYMTADGTYTSEQIRQTFGQLSDGDVGSLRLISDALKGKHNRPLAAQAMRYAIETIRAEGTPLALREIDARVQMWWQVVQPRGKHRWQAWVAAEKAERASWHKAKLPTEERKTKQKALEKRHFGDRPPSKLSAMQIAAAEFSGTKGHARLQGEYSDERRQLKGRVGQTKSPFNVDHTTLVTELRKNPPTFGSEATALYHARKHADEVPKAERTGQEYADYHRSLEKTIQEATPTIESAWDGGKRLIFRRKVDSNTMEAIVHVTRENTAVVLTFGHAKARTE